MHQYEKAFLNGILDFVNDAVTCVNREGVVIFWNRAAEHMYGIPKEQIIGKRIGEFFQKGSLMLYQVMETGCPVFQVYHTPQPDTHVLINATPIFNDSSELIGAISVEQNITSTVKLSEDLFQSPGKQNPKISIPFIVQRSAQMKQTVDYLTQTAKLNVPILFLGETGVGKQALAYFLHSLGSAGDPFLTLNCEALPPGLLDAELFGYQEDFLNVHRPDMQSGERQGKLDHAQNGILYIKNIHAMPLPTQVRLANAIRDRRFFRVGGMKPISFTCRILASSHPNLMNHIKDDTFSKELYYTFHLVSIPALKDRIEDIPELGIHFLEDLSVKLGKPIPRLSTNVIAALATYEWPGNLHEFKNVMERLMLQAKETDITLEHLPESLRLITLSEFFEESKQLTDLSEEMERKMIGEALKRTNGNKANAARLLGISRGSLYYKMKLYNMS
ncbi:sigma 54-interacting transcriptional regulator [Fodinisporobacter ferrooxydans]|uniref:Sigma 54-interacting transcriptional regulator n=1 Tax=Fodinisporobacter ferrooxydans TaxID=2901836 RepID=A0ABY4CLI5_9BACL|nr:sigma 54-interacting transcriptional regulator [Alicyclobacillaceae bacterium MYW30-H2]